MRFPGRPVFINVAPSTDHLSTDKTELYPVVEKDLQPQPETIEIGEKEPVIVRQKRFVKPFTTILESAVAPVR